MVEVRLAAVVVGSEHRFFHSFFEGISGMVRFRFFCIRLGVLKMPLYLVLVFGLFIIRFFMELWLVCLFSLDWNFMVEDFGCIV